MILNNSVSALNKLSSAQLIIDLFNKEHNQDSMDTAIFQQLRTDLEEYDTWILVMPRCPEVKIGDKNKNAGKVSECTIERTPILKNPNVAREVDSDIIRNNMKTNTVSETKISDIDSNQKDNKHKPVRYCTSKKDPVEEPQKKIVTQHYL